MCGTQSDSFMAVLRVVSVIATDADNALISRNLAEQRGQERWVADAVVRYFAGRISSVDVSIPRCTLRHLRR